MTRGEGHLSKGHTTSSSSSSPFLSAEEVEEEPCPVATAQAQPLSASQHFIVMKSSFKITV